MRTSMKFLAVTALATAGLGCGSDETTSTTEAQTTTTVSIATLQNMLMTVDDRGTTAGADCGAVRWSGGLVLAPDGVHRQW